MAVFREKSSACRKNEIKKALKKCLRTNEKHQKIHEHGYCGVAARNFLEKADLHRFLQSIDELMQNGQILKNGDTCFVSRINLAGQDIVIKRYNHKGIIHSARHTIKKSRARRCWLHAHRLTMLNIATPRPLAYVEQRRKKLVWKSYLITEFVVGQKLRDFLQDNKTGQQKRSKATQLLRELLDKLQKHRISHGDLKHTNILLTSEGPVLTDLDGMKAHKWSWTFKVKRNKDIARLTKNM